MMYDPFDYQLPPRHLHLECGHHVRYQPGFVPQYGMPFSCPQCGMLSSIFGFHQNEFEEFEEERREERRERREERREWREEEREEDFGGFGDF